MIDPIDSLAFSIASNKKIYALLLGSGVSRAAEIPTGWEIVLDMIRKLAVINGENAEPNPEQWYLQKFQEEPNYSNLLNSLAKTRDERSLLLRQYFEPNDEEREAGRKSPTIAHDAIANLVEGEYINLIITTNFDRLLEKALEKIGITPLIISTQDQIIGATPIFQNKCTILKINGDYLDSRIKNSQIELSKYDKITNNYLDRIFDEYGLIICGWSGEWDIALRNAIFRRKTRRYSYYWTLHGDITDRINSVISSQSAEVIKIIDADTFFSELYEKISALEIYQSYHPLSKKIAISRIKKYISDNHVIYASDLINQETSIFYRKLYEGDELKCKDINDEYIKKIENEMELLHAIYCVSCYWATKPIIPILVNSIERLVKKSEAYNWHSMIEKLKLYPTLLLLYSGGIITLASGQYELLIKLLSIKKRINANESEPLVIRINPMTLFGDDAKKIKGYEMNKTPLSNVLFDRIFPLIDDYIPDINEYELYFDRFEYIISLIVADYRMNGDNSWAPVGRYIWKISYSHHYNVVNDAKKAINYSGDLWGLLPYGLFDGNIHRLSSANDFLVKFSSTHDLRD